MEFKLISPKEESGFIQAVEFNFDELKQELTANLEKFNNVIYTDDSIQDAKKDRANLNKFKDVIETERKRIKKLCLKPYEEFELKVKELTGLIDKPILAIDTQVKTYEQKKKDDKLDEIKVFYIDNIGDLLDLLPFEKVFNEKMLNSSVSLKSVFDEITQKIDKVNFDLKTIKDLKSEYELTLIDSYLKTLDISEALREKTRLEERKKAIEEREAAQAEPVKELEQVQEAPEVLEMKQEKIHQRKFWVEGTAAQLTALGQYLKDNNIRYGGLE
jgi:hypothetical protein